MIEEKLKQEIMQLKANMCDLLLQSNDQKARLQSEVNEWQILFQKITNALDMSNPSLDEVFVKIKYLLELDKKKKNCRQMQKAL